MINKDAVLTMLQKRAEVQLQYIEAIKDDMKTTNHEIADIAVDFEVGLAAIDTDYIDELKVISIRRPIFNLIDPDYIHEDTTFNYKYCEIDGIRFRSEY